MQNRSLTVLVHGVERIDEVPGLRDVSERAQLRCARSPEELRRELPGAQVLLGWDFRADDLEQAWEHATSLEWIHWSGAGVDALLFPALVDSAVQVTNARGAFDQPMAEYVLGLAIALVKGLPQTLQAQREHRWSYRTAGRIAGQRALVVGPGSIGRAIARMLRAAGMSVRAVGRRARRGVDPDLGEVHGFDELDGLLPQADLVVLIAPLTPQTRGMFDARRFALMHAGAHLINVGRGALVDEDALVAALQGGVLAGAALDVFRQEPLAPDSPLWDAPGLVVSPHMAGDTHDFKEVVAAQFIANLRRFAAGEVLENRVDKALGFAAPG